MAESSLGTFVVKKSGGRELRKVPRQRQPEVIADFFQSYFAQVEPSLSYSALAESLSSSLGSITYFPETADDPVSELRMEIASLRETISGLRASIDTLAQNMSQIATPGALNADREIPLDQAKDEIKKLFEQKGNLYYSEIGEELRLDLGLVVQACRSLQEEGIIKQNEER